MYFVYVIVEECSRDVYVGYTADLEQRLEEHNTGRGAKDTKNGDWKLAYYEAFLSESDARIRERKLKHDGRAKYQLLGGSTDLWLGKSRCGRSWRPKHP